MIEVIGRRISNNLRLLNEDINKNFHSSLSDYNDLLFRVNNENVCKEVFETNEKYKFQGEPTGFYVTLRLCSGRVFHQGAPNLTGETSGGLQVIVTNYD
jgi:hypothetical protein